MIKYKDSSATTTYILHHIVFLSPMGFCFCFCLSSCCQSHFRLVSVAVVAELSCSHLSNAQIFRHELKENNNNNITSNFYPYRLMMYISLY